MNEQNAAPETPKRNSGQIVLRILIIAVILFVIPKFTSGDLFGKKAIDAAEKYVNQQVYTSLGLSCDRFQSEIIFKDGSTKLITVNFYFSDSSSTVGSYCVYCQNGYVVSSTTMMGANYPYRDYLSDLKDLFGI